MNIAVIGLGLIGASFAKGLQKYTNNKIYGYDLNRETVEKAKRDGTIDDIIITTNKDMMEKMDIVIVALHPVSTIETCLSALKVMRKGATLMDISGIKSSIQKAVEPAAVEADIDYVGTHPMAGRELWGYDAAVDDLFKGASFIISVTEHTNMEKVEMLKKIAEKMLFRETVLSNPEEHDRIIAFTSQLAHVVSNAYVKSPSILEEGGFSAGSFLDLTRVAKLNENMWCELFIMNKEALLFEVDTIIEKLQEYQKALQDEDIDTMRELLREGRIRKEENNEYHSRKHN